MEKTKKNIGMKKTPVLEIRNLSLSFFRYTGLLKKSALQVINDMSLSLFQGEMVAVVGASGSGKSLLAHSILGILPGNAALNGEMLYQGEPLTQDRIENLRGREIVLVPQSVSYLDPLMKIGPQIRKNAKNLEAGQKTTRVLSRYGMGPETEDLYPFELSGGMARRVLISTAVIEKPKLIIADEPTPGLHISAARRVLGHFREIADEGASVLLITHNLELAIDAADRVVVFYGGTTLEEALASDFSEESKLRHPYTRALWRAMPQNGFHAIKGMQPYAGHMPAGCPFFDSCPLAGEECLYEIPYIERNGGYVRCIREVGL